MKTFHIHKLEELTLLKCLYYLKAIQRVNPSTSKSQCHFFIQIDKTPLVLIWNHKRLKIPKAVLRKNKTGDITLTDFKIHSKAMVSKTIWYQHKDRPKDQQDRTQRLEINPCINLQLYLCQGCHDNTVVEEEYFKEF